jgi:hypothetical protein
VAPPGSAAGEDPATSPDLLAEWFEALDDDSARLGGGFAERLLDVTLRDALLLSLSGGSREDAVRFLDDPAAMENFMTAVPDRMMGARAAGLLAGAARNASEDGRAEVLAVLAWLAWWEGSGARSRLLVGEVLDVRPEHRLALLVQSALVRAVPPPWAPADAMACP